MTRSKHESTATSKLVNLTTKRDSVFMAFSVGVVIVPTPFWRENAVFAYPSWLRLCRVREIVIVAALLEPIDGLVARLIRGEHLRQEHTQSDPRRVNSISPL